MNHQIEICRDEIMDALDAMCIEHPKEIVYTDYREEYE